jgi:hypothetical protein
MFITTIEVQKTHYINSTTEWLESWSADTESESINLAIKSAETEFDVRAEDIVSIVTREVEEDLLTRYPNALEQIEILKKDYLDYCG